MSLPALDVTTEQRLCFQTGRVFFFARSSLKTIERMDDREVRYTDRRIVSTLPEVIQ